MEIQKNLIEDLIEFREKTAITELQYEYVRSVDERDWKTSVGFFHAEAKLYVLDRGKQRLFTKRNEIEYFYKGIARKDFTFSRHYIINPVVKVNGDKASFKSCYNAIYIHDTFTWIIYGRYDDKVVKEKGKWKILEKQIDHGWNDFFIPSKELTMSKEAIKEAKKRIFV